MAGVLHRDVSVGNILIVDRPEPNSFRGFIHDFDCSSMTETSSLKNKGSDEGVDLNAFVAAAEDELLAARKERTVSIIADLVC